MGTIGKSACLPMSAKHPGPYRSYRALLAAAILGPALLLAAIGWWSWNRVARETAEDVTRTVDLLHEHASKLFEMDKLLLAWIDDRMAGLDWPEVARRERALHLYLERLTQQVGDVDAAFVADASGELQALSRMYPVPIRNAPGPTPSNIRDRRYFQEARQHDGIVIDGPFKGRVSGKPIFDIARRLSSPDGSFRGVAVIVVSLDHLAAFWQSIVLPGDTVSLVRDDGVVLARYPAPAGGEAQPRRISPEGMERLRASNAGQVETVSSIDGVPRIIGYRRIEGYPIDIAYGVATRNIWAQWYPIFAAFAGLAAAASAALLLIARAVIRRGRGEAEALARAEQAAAALRQSEARYETLFRKAPMPMHALDPDHRLLDANDAWLAILGYARAEVIGRPITDFHIPDKQSVHDTRWRRLLETGEVRDAERTYVAKSGEIIETVVSATPERDEKGRLLRVISVVTDVTARRRAEEAARRERHFADLLVESSTEGIIAVDRELRYTVWNPAMEAISGIRHEDAIGRGHLEMFPHLRDTPVEAGWREAVRGKHSSLRDWAYDYRQSHRIGFLDQEFAPLYDADRTIIGAIAFVRDTTERRRMEEALRQSQKMEAVGQLTGGVAHDFNNLLTVVIGNLDSLQQRLAGADAESRRLIEAATRGAIRGATLTQRLLAFSRRQPLEPKPISPNKLVTGMSDLLQRTLGERIAVETVLAAGLWWVSADANQLESALLNLAVNARDAMPAGGKLTIETANVYLDESYAAGHEEVASGQYAMLAVSDTGTGMTREVADRAFEPFFTTKEVGQGTGLGLSQVYGFVKQSGGHVKIYSEPGQGTTVKLYLPRLAAGGGWPGLEPDQQAPAMAASGERILLVEDDEDVRGFGADALRELGYRVVEATDGTSALQLFGEEPGIDLLFTDVGLPGQLNGRQLADACRQRRPGLKVLFTTGYARNAITHHGRLDPGVELIAKPFTSAALAAKVRQILESG
jgi:PAS domain S-box-containing protein